MGLREKLAKAKQKLVEGVKSYVERQRRERALRLVFGEKYEAYRAAVKAGLLSQEEVEKMAKTRLKKGKVPKPPKKNPPPILGLFETETRTSSRRRKSRKKKRRKRKTSTASADFLA